MILHTMFSFESGVNDEYVWWCLSGCIIAHLRSVA